MPIGIKNRYILLVGKSKMEANNTAATAPEAPMLAKPGDSLYLINVAEDAATIEIK